MPQIISLQEAAKLVPAWAVLFLGGVGLERNCMAFTREFIRQKKNGLHLLVVHDTLQADFLALAGVVRIVEGSFSGSSALLRHVERGEALRSITQSGAIKVEEYSSLAMVSRLEAGARGLPFMPIQSMAGSDHEFHSQIHDKSQKMAVVECPFTSEFVGIVPSINPDFSFIHAQAADLQGNIYIQGALGADVVGLKAGDIKIVSVEEILDGPQAKKKYGDPMIFSFMVDYIVESSHGAYPTIVPKLYDGDLGYMELFSEYWRNEQGFQLFSNEWILDSEEKLFSHLGKDRLSSLRHS